MVLGSSAEVLGLEILVSGFQAAQKQIKAMDNSIGNTAKQWEGLTGFAKKAGRGLATAAKVGFKVVAGAAVLATGAIAGAGAALFSLAKDAAPLEGIGIAFEALSERFGVSLGAMRTASKGMIADFELMRQANVALTGAGDEFGAQFGQALPRLLQVAQAAARATGQDASFLFESLVTGIKRTSPMLIDNTGLQLRLGAANEALAQQLGKSVDELSAEERQIALLNATLEAGQSMVDDFGGGQLTAAEKMAQARAEMQNMKDAIGVALLPALSSLMDAFNVVWSMIGPEVISLFERLAGWLGENLPGMVSNFLAFWITAWPQIQQFLIDAWAIIQPIVQAISAWLTEEGPGALETWKLIFSEVWGVISEIIGSFSEWWAENKDLIIAAGEELSAFWNDNLKVAIETAWTAIKLIIGNALEVIQNGIELFLNIITGDWDAAWLNIQEILTNIWAAIETILAGTLETIANLFGSSMDEIGQVWSENWDLFLEVLSLAWQNVEERVYEGLENARSTIKSFIGNFQTAGRELMDGIINGITAKAGALVDAIKQAIEQAIEAAKNVLGIQSPSTVFASIGRNTLAGMSLGLSQMAPVVQSVMQQSVIPQTLGVGGIVNNSSASVTNNYNLTTQSMVRPGGLALEFQSMEMLTR